MVANFNVHCGMDGWARRFDVVAACAEIDADVLVLEESWAPDGGQSLASRVAAELGYELAEAELARARVLDEDPALLGPDGPASWAPRWSRRRVPRALLLEAATRKRPQAARATPGRARRPGSWGIAVLWRVPARRVEVLDLRQLRGDLPRRRAVLLELECGLTVAGAHLAHLSDGSVRQMRQLAGELARRGGAMVLTGDMNSWTFPLVAMLPGWRKAVHGRTWPAAMPHSQIDHLLVTGGVEASGGEVLPPLGSDHRAIRATVRLR
ncbi:MAG TPA: endonuclease/exonuclease/phosphatase family protein [Acidimicrobiales bacterium]|nr:endonuclease/exonuclease/phosphatase family protein [Acidimicrobiales bacterium]